MRALLSMSPKRRALALKIGALAGVNVALLLAGIPLRGIFERLHTWWWAGQDWPSGASLHRVLDLIGHGFAAYLFAGCLSVFAVSVALLPLGFLARTLARARLRAGGADPFVSLRGWDAAHPRLVRALTIVPAAMWSFLVGLDACYPWADDGQELGVWASFGIVGVLVAAALTELTRAGLRAFVAPVVDDAEPRRSAVAKDDVAFDAVAVTGETRAAVIAMAILGIGAFALALSEKAFRDPHILAALAAYAAIALGGAAAFRGASKVAIGVDGVLVRGTSRTRFFAYRDLDAARVEAGDLELVRKDKVVLRLQLHGEDAPRRAAVLERIRAAIDLVKEGRGAASAQLVSAASHAELVRAAGGAADYRGAALTREQLWALVEGPEVAAAERTAAAAALAKSGDDGERARLRVAAEHCAAPEVRVALARLAEGDVPDGEDAERGSPAFAAVRRAS